MPPILAQYSVKRSVVQGVGDEKRERNPLAERLERRRWRSTDRLAIPAAARSQGASRPARVCRAGIARRQLRRSARPAGRGDVFEKKTRGPPHGAVHNPKNGEYPMELMMVDPRALKENPDQMRRSKSCPLADSLLLASIKDVGIVHL